MVVLEPCFLFRETARLGMKDCLETPPSVFFGSDIVDRGGLSNFSASDDEAAECTAQRAAAWTTYQMPRGSSHPRTDTCENE